MHVGEDGRKDASLRRTIRQAPHMVHQATASSISESAVGEELHGEFHSVAIWDYSLEHRLSPQRHTMSSPTVS